MLEKRIHPRIEVSSTVLYSKDIYPRLTIASILDLSMGGTKIETLYGLNKGEELEITIGIQSGSIKCRGKVVHVSLPQKGRVKAGIQFEELSPHDKLLLRQHLSYLIERGQS
jgi:hypothetical protein